MSHSYTQQRGGVVSEQLMTDVRWWSERERENPSHLSLSRLVWWAETFRKTQKGLHHEIKLKTVLNLSANWQTSLFSATHSNLTWRILKSDNETWICGVCPAPPTTRHVHSYLRGNSKSQKTADSLCVCCTRRIVVHHESVSSQSQSCLSAGVWAVLQVQCLSAPVNESISTTWGWMCVWVWVQCVCFPLCAQCDDLFVCSYCGTLDETTFFCKCVLKTVDLYKWHWLTLNWFLWFSLCDV